MTETKTLKNPARILTPKNRQKLSPIEKKLLECCKSRQPVLLCGKDPHDREDLVKKIHSLNGGYDKEWEYQGDEERTKMVDGMREELRKLLADPLGDIKRDTLYKGIYKDINRYERIYKHKGKYKDKNKYKGYEDPFNKYMLDCNDTPRTYKYDDWGRKSGQAVSDDLSKFEYKRIDSGGKFKYDLLKEGSHIWRNHPDKSLLKKQYERSDTKELLRYKGTLFLDNLWCKKGDAVDENGYVELALKIESIKKVPRSQRGWLVFYTRYRSTFPPEFIKQFGSDFQILLDGEGKQQEEKDGRAKAKRRVKSGTLSKGKGFKIPKEKFIGTLKETYSWCKKEEEKGEEWPGTKIAERAKRLLKSRYGNKYDANFKASYLENIVSKIKKGEV